MRQVAKKGLMTAVATGGVLVVTGGYAYADAGAAGVAAGSPGVLSGNNVQVPVHIPVNACGNTVDVIGVLNPAFGNNCVNDSHGGLGPVGGGAGAVGGSTGSPGVISGNTAQVPVHVPVNLCGNSVNPIGVLNPAFGNNCANVSHGGGAGVGSGTGAGAVGGSTGSPGVGSGNTAQVPVHVPVNVCGNTVDVVGVLNPVFGNTCGNGPAPGRPVVPPTPTSPRHAPPPTHVPTHVPTHTPTQTPPQRSRQTPRHAATPRHSSKHARTPMSGQEAPVLAHTGAAQVGLAGGAGLGMVIGGFVLYRRGRAMRRS